jgi:hypothetical protein
MSSLRDAMSIKIGDKEIKNVETIQEANYAKEYYVSHQSTWMLVKGQDNI